MYSKDADSRAVPEQGVLRRRALRRRGGVARLLRQARLRADGRGGGAARRAREVAVELRADRQPGRARSRGGTSCCRRCSRPGPSIARRGRRRARDTGRAARRPAGRRAARAVLQGAGAPRARRAVRLGARLPGRPARVLDDRHADAEGRRSGGRRGAEGARRAPRQALRDAARRRRAASAAMPSRCRRRSSRSIRQPATCARWSAAATSTRAASTAPCRRSRQPGSAFKPFVYAAALEAGYTPATIIEHLERADRHARRAPGRRRTSIRPTTRMSLRAGAAHVEQPRRRAPAPGGRHPKHRASTPRRWASATCRACRRWRSGPAKSRCSR